MTFEEMCKARDPLYAAMQPIDWYQELLDCDASTDPGKQFFLHFAAATYQMEAMRLVRGYQRQPYYSRP